MDESEEAEEESYQTDQEGEEEELDGEDLGLGIQPTLVLRRD